MPTGRFADRFGHRRSLILQQIEAKTHSLELIGLVVMMAAGGILVETIGFAAAWIASALDGAIKTLPLLISGHLNSNR